MQVVDQVKLAFAHSLLRKESRDLRRERTDPNIHSASSIGILYDATNREEFEIVREFFMDLRESRKKAVSLGYIDFKETLSFHPLARPECDYFFKHQLNWYNKPTSSVVQHFIQEPFDILISLTMKDIYQIDYIAALSKAGLKIGRADSKVSWCYDMSFFIDPTSDIKTLAYTIIHYLSQLNHERAAGNQGKRSSHYYTV